MTVEELGQQAQAKYPYYQQFSAAEVGQKVIAKYPYYKDKVTQPAQQSQQQQPQQSQIGSTAVNQTLGNVAGGVANFVAPALKAGGQALSNQLNYNKTLPNATGNLPQAVSNAVSSTGNLAKEVAGTAMPDLETALNFNAFPLAKTAKNLTNFTNLRNLTLGNRAVDTGQMEQGVNDILKSSDFFKNAPAEQKKAATQGLNDFLSNLNPTKGESTDTTLSQNASTPLKDMYKQLKAFETVRKPYARGSDYPSAVMAQGANQTSHAVRDYLNTQIPKTTKILNKLYSTGVKGKGVSLDSLKKVAPFAIGASILGLINHLTSGGGQQSTSTGY